jgi:hypothetical protein
MSSIHIWQNLLRKGMAQEMAAFTDDNDDDDDDDDDEGPLSS